MVISCIGDSITEGDYGVYGRSGIANVHRENYPFFLAENTGWTVRNYGHCGFTTVSYLACYKEGAADCSGSDCVLIMLGANGGLSAEKETPANGAYRELISLLRRDVPDAMIVLLTPTHVTEDPSFSNCGYAGNISAGGAFTRLLAAECGLPLIETARIPEFTPENEKIYQANDGVHFVEAGYRVLAAYIEKELRRLPGFRPDTV